MITINLQLIAFVFWAISAWFVYQTVYWLIDSIRNRGLEQILDVALTIRAAALAVVFAVVGLLIFWAFSR